MKKNDDSSQTLYNLGVAGLVISSVCFMLIKVVFGFDSALLTIAILTLFIISGGALLAGHRIDQDKKEEELLWAEQYITEGEIQAKRKLPKVECRYQKLREALQVPDWCLPVEIYEPIDSSGAVSYACDCWVLSNTLHLIRQFCEIQFFAQEHPYCVNDDGTGLNMFQMSIPIDKIHHFTLEGAVYQTTEVSGGGNAQYMGASVNGIGFGELQHDPVHITNTIHDERRVILFYMGEEAPMLQRLYFTSESYENIVRLIPDKEYRM